MIGALTGHARRPGAAAGGEASELDAEARKLLLDHAKMIKDSAADYRQLLGKVREKLARERGFIL